MHIKILYYCICYEHITQKKIICGDQLYISQQKNGSATF